MLKVVSDRVRGREGQRLYLARRRCHGVSTSCDECVHNNKHGEATDRMYFDCCRVVAAAAVDDDCDDACCFHDVSRQTGLLLHLATVSPYTFTNVLDSQLLLCPLSSYKF